MPVPRNSAINGTSAGRPSAARTSTAMATLPV